MADSQFLVLHALRIRGVADQEALARVTGVAPAEVVAVADALTESGLAIRRTGRFAGWALTAPGRQRYEALLSDERDRVGTSMVFAQAYDRFVALNEEFKVACTAWQVRDLEAQVMNDHGDPAYDAEVVGRLGAVHQAALPVVGGLASVLPRFGGYRDRLDNAYRRVQAGDRDAFARPLSESYHDVWMELHQDLLLTLDISREAAGDPSA